MNNHNVNDPPVELLSVENLHHLVRELRAQRDMAWSINSTTSEKVLRDENITLKQSVENLQKVILNYIRLTHDLDVIWNGEDKAAAQPSLAHLVSQIDKDWERISKELLSNLERIDSTTDAIALSNLQIWESVADAILQLKKDTYPFATEQVKRLESVLLPLSDLSGVVRSQAKLIAELEDQNEGLQSGLDTDYAQLYQEQVQINAKQSAALKLARVALQAMHSLDEENHQRYSGDEDICTETRMCREALAAIDALKDESRNGDARWLIAANLTSLGGYRVKRCEMGINEIAAKHYDWVERMGWHNKTVLETLALIASEVGEAINECRGEAPTHEFGTELADIILRVADLAQWQGIDLALAIASKMESNEQRGTRGRRV